jgi:hypothetical protein
MAESKGEVKTLSVDKSGFIETLEKCGNAHVMMLRPHGFGKSHLIDMLFQYYDKSSAEVFNENYAGSYIRMHPTPLKNGFRVIKFVFTGLRGVAEDSFDDSFRKCVADGLSDFVKRNSDFEFAGAIEDEIKDDPIFAFTSICLNFSQQFPSEKIYLLIEDYDNFAYDVLFENRMDLVFKDVVNDFYDSIKSVLNVTIGRTFVTGVFPIELGSLFGESGQTTVRNLASFRSFANLTGFTSEDIKYLITDYVGKGRAKRSAEEIMRDLDERASGYIFSPYGSEQLYNPRDCSAYLHGKKNADEIERYQKRLNTILDLSQGIDLKDLLDKIFKKSLLKLTNVTPFLKLSLVSSYNLSDLLSLLFYLGYLTMAPESIKKTGAVALVCPNKHMESFFRKYYEEKKFDQDDIEF